MLVMQDQVCSSWCSDESSDCEEVWQVVDVLVRCEASQRRTDLISYSLSAFSRCFETFRNRLLRSRPRWFLQVNRISPFPIIMFRIGADDL